MSENPESISALAVQFQMLHIEVLSLGFKAVAVVLLFLFVYTVQHFLFHGAVSG